jgi:hypothetical protein
MDFEQTFKLIISASVVGILYYAYSYINSTKPPIVDVKPVDHKLLNIDPAIIHNASKSICIESKKPISEFVITDLLHQNPIIIGGCAVFIAFFLVY